MKIEMTLQVKDEAYPHIIYLLRHIEGVEILEDNYTQDKTNNQELFINDIIKVYEKYNLSLGHEDTQGAFKIMTGSQKNIDWLKETLL